MFEFSYYDDCFYANTNLSSTQKKSRLLFYIFIMFKLNWDSLKIVKGQNLLKYLNFSKNHKPTPRSKYLYTSHIEWPSKLWFYTFNSDMYKYDPFVMIITWQYIYYLLVCDQSNLTSWKKTKLTTTICTLHCYPYHIYTQK